jgi:hypothetical protein
MIAMIARAALTPEDEALLASVRKALADIWADPVLVRHVAMSRSTARAIERDLARRHLSFNRATPSRRVGVAPLPSGPHTHTAPRYSRQPTLARGCEARPAASDNRRGDKRQACTLGMDAKGETFFHGDNNAR